MAKASKQNTQMVLAVGGVVIVAYLIYKVLPALLRRPASSANGSTGYAGYAGTSYNPFAPYNPFNPYLPNGGSGSGNAPRLSMDFGSAKGKGSKPTGEQPYDSQGSNSGGLMSILNALLGGQGDQSALASVYNEQQGYGYTGDDPRDNIQTIDGSGLGDYQLSELDNTQQLLGNLPSYDIGDASGGTDGSSSDFSGGYDPNQVIDTSGGGDPLNGIGIDGGGYGGGDVGGYGGDPFSGGDPYGGDPYGGGGMGDYGGDPLIGIGIDDGGYTGGNYGGGGDGWDPDTGGYDEY